VQSALAQTFQDIEIVVVDDGSTDPATIAVLDRFERPKTRVLRIPNSGPSFARNRGIEAGSGEFILPLDADDRIEPTYVEKAVQLLDRDDRMHIVYCKAEYFGSMSGPWELPPYSWPEMLWVNPIFVTAVFRRSIWEKAGGFSEESRDGWEDWEFWLKTTGAGAGVHCLPERLFWYRVSPSSRCLDTLSDRKRKNAAYDRLVYGNLKLYARHVAAMCENRLWLHRREHAAALIALRAMVPFAPLSGYPLRFYAAFKLLAWSVLAPLKRFVLRAPPPPD
jgi:glycosyltransferase involved in cell wall biosynthesis